MQAEGRKIQTCNYTMMIIMPNPIVKQQQFII